MLRGKGLLTPIQRSFISEFATLPDQAQFHLAGDTALAEYYLGHRLSFDLDFFTSRFADFSGDSKISFRNFTEHLRHIAAT